jgi:hypothetical protein
VEKVEVVGLQGSTISECTNKLLWHEQLLEMNWKYFGAAVNCSFLVFSFLFIMQ